MNSLILRQGQHKSLMHWNGEIVKMSFEKKNRQKWANGVKMYDPEKNGPQRLVFPHPGAIYSICITMIFEDLLL